MVRAYLFGVFNEGSLVPCRNFRAFVFFLYVLVHVFNFDHRVAIERATQDGARGDLSLTGDHSVSG